jgi:peptidoglycan/LPS O-acetylase OafA/YrhL
VVAGAAMTPSVDERGHTGITPRSASTRMIRRIVPMLILCTSLSPVVAVIRASTMILSSG